MSHTQLDDGQAVAASKQPEWVQEFNAALARRDYKAPVTPGPHCCAICCTFFASIGALFLFLISGLMSSRYPYVHIHGESHEETASMASNVAWAGVMYTLIALVAVCYWMQGNAARQEYEDSEREEASLLGGGAEAEEEAKH